MKQDKQVLIIDGVEYDNVYATKFFRIGDKVVMNMDKEARGWGRKGQPDGAKGTIMGFYEYFTTRNINQGEVPGIYRGNGAAVVQWEDGTATHESHDLALPKDLIETRRNDDVYNKSFEKNLFVSKWNRC